MKKRIENLVHTKETYAWTLESTLKAQKINQRLLMSVRQNNGDVKLQLGVSENKFYATKEELQSHQVKFQCIKEELKKEEKIY